MKIILDEKELHFNDYVAWAKENNQGWWVICFIWCVWHIVLRKAVIELSSDDFINKSDQQLKEMIANKVSQAWRFKYGLSC